MEEQTNLYPQPAPPYTPLFFSSFPPLLTSPFDASQASSSGTPPLRTPNPSLHQSQPPEHCSPHENAASPTRPPTSPPPAPPPQQQWSTDWQAGSHISHGLKRSKQPEAEEALGQAPLASQAPPLQRPSKHHPHESPRLAPQASKSPQHPERKK